MNVPATNKTDEAVTLAGEKIKAGTQASIREENISQAEIEAIKESGAVLKRDINGYTVSVPEESDYAPQKDEDDQGGDDGDNDSGDEPKDVVHVTYPAKLINKNGELSGSNAVKSIIAKVQEAHDNLLTDAEFAAEYPGQNPDDFRVEVEDAE